MSGLPPTGHCGPQTSLSSSSSQQAASPGYMPGYSQGRMEGAQAHPDRGTPSSSPPRRTMSSGSPRIRSVGSSSTTSLRTPSENPTGKPRAGEESPATTLETLSLRVPSLRAACTKISLCCSLALLYNKTPALTATGAGSSRCPLKPNTMLGVSCFLFLAGQ